MIERTVIIVGPGGVGKSPLDALFRDDIIKIDPYRLRPSGPRDSNDIFYAHPKLRIVYLRATLTWAYSSRATPRLNG